MSVAFTGATGFLGCRLVRELLARDTGEVVTVLGRGDAGTLRTRVEAAVGRLEGPPLPPGALDRLRYTTVDLARPVLGLTPYECDRLTDGLTSLWHCAAMVNLQGDPASLYRANVLGTRGVLELADRAPRARPIHISTAFVAGRRSTGHVLETDLSDAWGFHVPYEESKFTAERLVHAWARRTGRTATVLRPSLLVADRRVPEGLPDHPAGVLSRLVAGMLRAKAREDVTAARLLNGGSLTQRYRLPGEPAGTINVLQAGYAAAAMARAAAAPSAPGVSTLHVTHPHNTPVETVLGALAAPYAGVVLEMVPDLFAPTPDEAELAGRLGGLLAYSSHRRTYDRAHLLRAVGGLPDPPPVTAACLARATAPDGAADG
ncbi:SDR family oxidoreductase [Streptomyces syringium]|uniref:SDR family oxidoreductase n=1 Tax=Streptomyces syringium TaxID=76729 RepID=UPI00343DE072